MDRARGTLRRDPASCLWALYLHGIQKDRVLSRESRDGAQKETARDVLTRVFVTELMAGSEDYGKHYSGGKATRQEIMVSRSLGSTRGRITLWREEKARSVWFIGDYGRDIGTYAFCLTFAGSPRWELLTARSSGKYENGFTVHSSHHLFSTLK